MKTNWIKNVLQTLLPQTLGQGAATYEKKAKAKLEMGDGPHPSAEEVQKQSAELGGIIKKTGETLNAVKLRVNARRKVKKNIASFYDMDGLPEEITEKLVEAAEADPFFKKWFK